MNEKTVAYILSARVLPKNLDKQVLLLKLHLAVNQEPY